MMINQTPNPVCGSLRCQTLTPHSHLSMPDPCPHITRLDMISARLNNECNELDAYTDHLNNCTGV